MNTRQSLYADPMIYDILHSPNTAREVTVLEKIEALFSGKELPADRWWLEPACGTGRYLRVAKGRGRRVAGFDLDRGQLRYAQQRLPQAILFQGDMSCFLAKAKAAGLKPGQADFAFNTVNSIRLLSSDRLLLAHLEEMARILKPGAVYVIGISLTDYRRMLPEEDLWESARGRCRVSQLINFIPPVPGTKRARVETALSHLTVTRPRGQEHFDDVYDLRTYDQRQWQDLIDGSALDFVGSFDAGGRPLGNRTLPYQLEVLGCASENVSGP